MFDQNINELESLLFQRNFGDKFLKCIILIENATFEVRANADDLIFNITPIISFIHYKIKSTLGEI